MEGTAGRLVWSRGHSVRGHATHRLRATVSDAVADAEEQGDRIWCHTRHTNQDFGRRQVHQGNAELVQTRASRTTGIGNFCFCFFGKSAQEATNLNIM